MDGPMTVLEIIREAKKKIKRKIKPFLLRLIGRFFSFQDKSDKSFEIF
jgi:hypothetical protein